MDLDDLIATAAPRTMTVQVCGRGDLAALHESLVAQLRAVAVDPDESSLAGNPKAKDLAQQIVDVEEQMAGVTKDLTVKAVSRNAWADLLAEHPPSKEQLKAGETMNPRTFPVAALVVCSHDPKVSTEQAEALANNLPSGEWQKLWYAIVALNTQQTTVPKLRAATDLLQANEPSSTTSVPAPSRGASSLDGSGSPEPTTSTTTPDA